MAENHERKCGPLVSVLVPTFNRPRYLAEALNSVLRQNYSNLQVFVINDGGQDVEDIITSLNDPRLIYINRKENQGKAFTLNQALSKAEGKYIAYLDDDDVYYPNHIETLVDVLENQTDCQVAYSDLYKVCCRIMPDGSRQVLSKVVEISRDFDRFFMLYFNHIIHPALMHRKDLLENTGLYNENVKVLIDWDMTRRLVFFTDFYHVHEITGQQYTPVGECDRISIQRRKNKYEYLKNVMTIRTTRPAKPWSKIEDLSIIFVTDQIDTQAKKTLNYILQYTFYPCEIYLPVPKVDLAIFSMPNVIHVPVDSTTSLTQRIDTVLEKCDGEYVAVVPSGFPIRRLWLEDYLYALVNSSSNREGFELEDSTDKLWALVVRKDDLKRARRNFPSLSVHESLEADGILMRCLQAEEIPFQFDQIVEQARFAEEKGEWQKAALKFEYVAEHYQNQLWMKTLAARAFFNANNFRKAEELGCEVNRQRPTVDTLLLEGKIKRLKEEYQPAIELLEQAEQILEGKELLWI